MYRIDAAYKAPPSGGFSDKQNALFQAFGMCLLVTQCVWDISPNLYIVDESLEHINKARAGDHGRYVIEEARINARLSGIDIKTMSMGTNPVCDHCIRHFA
jgi:hypothetical protein